jgi:hypothetical protein
MKKRTAIILVVVAFSIGGYGGFFLSTRLWTRIVVGPQLVTSSLHEVVMVYPALKLLREGQTERATHLLQGQLHNALGDVDLMSQTLRRPDMLTNSIVVRARAMDTNSAAINPVEPTSAPAGARGSP